MNCWHCGTELIWGGDHDLEDFDLDDYEDMEYDICPLWIGSNPPVTRLNFLKNIMLHSHIFHVVFFYKVYHPQLDLSLVLICDIVLCQHLIQTQ